MKRLDEYSNAELLVLTEDQIVNLINVECAHEGAPLLMVEAPEAPVKPDVHPNVECFVVEAGTLRFMDMKKAQEVAAFLNRQPRLDTEGIGKHTWQAPYQLVPVETEIGVATQRHWTPSFYRQHQEELERYQYDKKIFDSANREFREQREARDRVCNNVTDRIDDARRDERLREQIRSQFEEYCALADGKLRLALKFLLKATPHDEEFVRTTLEDRLVMQGEEDYGEEAESEGRNDEGSREED
jgi:hypothetical protein